MKPCSLKHFRVQAIADSIEIRLLCDEDMLDPAEYWKSLVDLADHINPDLASIAGITMKQRCLTTFSSKRTQLAIY